MFTLQSFWVLGRVPLHISTVTTAYHLLPAFSFHLLRSYCVNMVRPSYYLNALLVLENCCLSPIFDYLPLL
jgi:hypothetical protein